MRKKTITELRRAIRQHALAVAEIRRAESAAGDTETRLHTALMDVATELGGEPFSDAFRGSASKLREADGLVWRGGNDARDELVRLAGVLAIPLPKKLTR